MALRETIAYIGPEKEIYAAFIQKLVNAYYRVLLVSENEAQLLPYLKSIKTAFPDGDIETVPCAKEGCWEADIILLAGDYMEHAAIIHKISEVATQKIVASLLLQNDRPPQARAQSLQKRLPHAKILELTLGPSDAEALVSGSDTEALAAMKNLLQKCGLEVKQISTRPSPFINPDHCL